MDRYAHVGQCEHKRIALKKTGGAFFPLFCPFQKENICNVLICSVLVKNQVPILLAWPPLGL